MLDHRHARVRCSVRPHDSYLDGPDLFVTNRLLRFGEVYYDTQSTAFNLTAGEFELNDQDKKKSTGVLFPLAQLAIDKEGQLQVELNQNPWKLVDVLDWKGTPGAN